MNKIEFATNLLSILTIISQILIVIILISLTSKKFEGVLNFFKRKAIKISLVVALTATLGSLFYSEIAEYTPCLLCWYQRIFMYPMVILFGIALLIKDKTISIYALSLSVIGAILAGFHYYMQISGTELTSCSTVGYSASCSDNFVMNFNYITIPMMALSAFLLIALLMIVLRKK